MFRLMCVSSILLLAACAPMRPQTVPRLPFNEAEFSKLPTSGTGSITGQAFLSTRGGQVRTAAGQDVHINPVTSLSDQWMMVTCNGGKQLDVFPDRRYDALIRTSVADGDGRFTFTDLPPGRYYVTTRVTWSVPVGRYSSQTQGGLMAGTINVENGRASNIVLSQRNLCAG